LRLLVALLGDVERGFERRQLAASAENLLV